MTDEELLVATRSKLEAHVTDALDEGHKKLDSISRRSRTLIDKSTVNNNSNPLHLDFAPESTHG